MHIECRSVDELQPYPSNPRVNDDAVDAVAKSIEAFGFRVPILVDPDDMVVAGHTRLKAAQQLRMSEVPVHVVKGLTPDEIRALRLADNRTAEIATWDLGLLAGELTELKDAGLDLDVLGFEESEIGRLLHSAGGSAEGQTDPDVPVDPGAETVTMEGDLWVLGEHRLLCGDATNPDDVDRLMDGEQAALVATDPPYLVDYTGDRPNDSGKDWSKDYREIDITDAESFFRGVFTNIRRVVAPHAAIYCWHAHKRCGVIQQIWEELGILDHQAIVWVKPTPVFGRVFWHFRHEPCMMGWIKGSKPEHDGDHSMEMSSVWELGWEHGKARIAGNEHPTQKPVEIFARPMRKHTNPGDLCFEPFSGSGSQLIAGTMEGRRVNAMEIAPPFVDAAVRRWQRFTGDVARRFDVDGIEQPGMVVDEHEHRMQSA